ncbi:MAG: excinuclease ABC subunit UvrA [Phycisphaerae bacterium]|nr:excinuclease ABC subunit UvrA [Phycisphaerae bacterium]
MIRVRGAREHNLKNISVDLPRDRLVVVTGLSGSGKSSLAFDTLFAEGQRKYMESLSAYARQFLDQLKKPDVDEIEGIPPTIAIEQRTAGSNPRSTVATTTEIYDYLRLLFARCGTPHSWAPTRTKKDGAVLERSGVPIRATSATQIVDAILLAHTAPARIMILAPVARGKKGFHRDILESLAAQGWARARVNGTIVELREALKDPGENPLKLGRYEAHDIEAVVDRVSVTADARQRLAESVEAALKLGQGALVVSAEQATGSWADRSFSSRFADPEHPEYALDEIEPRLFSFNSPFGACPGCHGLGTILEFDERLVLPNDKLSLAEGAVAAWNKNGPVRAWFNRKLRRFCKDFGVAFGQPVREFPPDARHALLHGTGAADAKARSAPGRARFEGVIPNITQWWSTTENAGVKEWLGTFLSQSPCRVCLGDRLRIEALHVLLASDHPIEIAKLPHAGAGSVIGRPRGAESGGRLSHLNIAELARLTITDALDFVAGLRLSPEGRIIAEPILKEINNRLRFLTGVGLEYLSLDRKTATLSGGEAQRIRLASQVGSGLVGACYVLDEPTIGLHQRDNARLIDTLRHLTDIGNTVIVVEHDEDMIRAADHVLDIGPGPGVHGGRVVAQGSVGDIIAEPGSLTGQYLSGRRKVEPPERRRPLSVKRAVSVKGARQNNLRDVDAAFPLGGLVCVTGVSGSGKSTLVNDILLAALKQQVAGARIVPGTHDRVTGVSGIDRVVEVDQSPIGRTPRSNPATYTGIFGDIRNVFAQSKESKIRGYKPGRFSFNVRAEAGGGRCEACQGQGLKKIEMHFLPDVYVECEVCKGKRYNRETLEVLFKGQSIADVLDMTVERACAYFENHPRIQRHLLCLRDVGLDYIRLGQPSTTLSGGEAQRVKLATELGAATGLFEVPASARDDEEPHEDAPGAARPAPRASSGRSFYVLDEPTTGLHFEDIRRLVGVLQRLADAGNTLVVIEHNLDVIKCADWIIDLGPEGGLGGGRIIAQGTPEAVAATPASHTGRYLKSVLAR